MQKVFIGNLESCADQLMKYAQCQPRNEAWQGRNWLFRRSFQNLWERLHVEYRAFTRMWSLVPPSVGVFGRANRSVLSPASATGGVTVSNANFDQGQWGQAQHPRAASVRAVGSIGAPSSTTTPSNAVLDQLPVPTLRRQLSLVSYWDALSVHVQSVDLIC